mgnify:CR=1 FL=1
MLDDLKEILSNLESSQSYLKWKEEHEDAFLSSFFIVDKQGWQLAFYSPKKNKVSTFSNGTLVQADSAIFKHKEDKVEQLNLDEVSLIMEEALNIAKKELEATKPGLRTTKTILVLQKIDTVLWNISFLTSSFYIFNIKINASNKQIISQDFISSLYSNPKKNKNLL